MNKNEIELQNPSGGYWDKLKNLGLPNYIILKETKEIVIIKRKGEKKNEGEGKENTVLFPSRRWKSLPFFKI